MRAGTISTLDLPENLPENAEAPASRIVAIAQPGMRLGRYLLVEQLARGGMAEVWIGSHSGPLGFQRLVAIKTIRPDRADDLATRKMFLDEARIAARLRHSNVVEVLDLGEQGELVYQVMPLIEGDSLSGLLRRATQLGERLPLAVVLRIVTDACRGLHAAHELRDDVGTPLGLVHRDVSPQNILVGGDGIAKIADFGVAKALGRMADETVGYQLRGKLAYLSPEQVERRPLDRRSDLFSIGIVLWESLTGARLFKGADEIETIDRVRTLAVPDPRTLVAAIPAAIASVTMRALARARDERFGTSDEMADALEEAARASGLVASAKDTARVVARLAAPDIARRRALATAAQPRAVSPMPQPESGVVTVTAPMPEPERAPQKRPRVVLAVAAVFVACACVAGAVVRLWPGRASVAVVASATSPNVPTVDRPSAAADTAAEPAASSASPAKPPTSVAPGIVPRRAAPRPRSATPSRAESTASTRPQVLFPSPYGP